MFGAIHIRWKQLRPDLHHPSDDSREQLLELVSSELRLQDLQSLKELNNRQLARVLDVLASEQGRKGPNVVRLGSRTPRKASDSTDTPGVVEHLAGLEQIWAINSLFGYLGWREGSREEFIAAKFHGRRNPAHLRPKEANVLLWILLRTAASKDLKAGTDRKISKKEINAYIPKLKAQLGIDRKE